MARRTFRAAALAALLVASLGACAPQLNENECVQDSDCKYLRADAICYRQNGWCILPTGEAAQGLDSSMESRQDAAEPDAAAPEPDAAAPEPDAAAPEPDAAAPEPDAAAPEPDAAAPEPDAAAPEPDAAAPEPDAAAPAPDAADPDMSPAADAG